MSTLAPCPCCLNLWRAAKSGQASHRDNALWCKSRSCTSRAESTSMSEERRRFSVLLQNSSNVPSPLCSKVRTDSRLGGFSHSRPRAVTVGTAVINTLASRSERKIQAMPFYSIAPPWRALQGAPEIAKAALANVSDQLHWMRVRTLLRVSSLNSSGSGCASCARCTS